MSLSSTFPDGYPVFTHWVFLFGLAAGFCVREALACCQHRDCWSCLQASENVCLPSRKLEHSEGVCLMQHRTPAACVSRELACWSARERERRRESTVGKHSNLAQAAGKLALGTWVNYWVLATLQYPPAYGFLPCNPLECQVPSSPLSCLSSSAPNGRVKASSTAFPVQVLL